MEPRGRPDPCEVDACTHRPRHQRHRRHRGGRAGGRRRGLRRADRRRRCPRRARFRGCPGARRAGAARAPGRSRPTCRTTSSRRSAPLGAARTRRSGPCSGGDTTVIDFAFCVLAGERPRRDLEQEGDLRGPHGAGLGAACHSRWRDPFEVMEEIGDVVKGGIPTIKTMTTYGWMCDDRSLLRRHERGCGGRRASVIHAEDDEIARWLTKKYAREGKTHGAYIGETRPSLVEEAAVRRALLLAERIRLALYILHMAAAAGWTRSRRPGEGAAVLRGDADAVPLLSPPTTCWKTSAACSQQLPDDQDAGRPGCPLGSDRRRPDPGGDLRTISSSRPWTG